MEHVNATTSSLRQNQHPPQSHQHHPNQQQQQQQQQQHQHDNQQQFCLRWHNHQTSLLSTLPILLDQSHLTDVTLSAEGRTLRAHRVVLSACSTFFLELFRALDANNHPVIIIPGASFAAIVALLTFMYSGEVNVFEEQIPTLLNLAETLGIKGLADVQNNKSAKRQTDIAEQLRKAEVDTPPTPTTPPDFMPPQPQHENSSTLLPPPPSLVAAAAATTTVPTLTAPTLCNKIPTPLESLFIKSLQFYPNLLPQPLNFSQSALNKTSELIAKYQQHCDLYQSALGSIAGKDFMQAAPPSQVKAEDATATLNSEDTYNAKRLCTTEKKQQQQQQQAPPPPQQQQQQQPQPQQKDIKRIDRIVESLRCSNGKTQSGDATMSILQQQQQQQQQHQQQQHYQQQQLQLKTSIANFAQSISPNLATKPPVFVSAATHFQQQQQQQQELSPTQHIFMSAEEQFKFQQQLEHFANCNRNNTPDTSCHIKPEANLLSMPEKLPTPTPSSPQAKTSSNSKLYATCFICHKQLSNQYNLRVHLETHQNVRYACNVCSHVSRSKDALRKHVSYRHPGAPSPCESEARRKRAKTLNIPTSSSVAGTTTIVGTSPPSPASAPTTPFQLSNLTATPTSISNMNDTTEATPSPPINSSAYMFLPSQFHLAATAAAANLPPQLHQLQQQQIKTSTTASNMLPATSEGLSTIATMSLATCAETDSTTRTAATSSTNFMSTNNTATATTATATSEQTTVGSNLNATSAVANSNANTEHSPAEAPSTHSPIVAETIGNTSNALSSSSSAP